MSQAGTLLAGSSNQPDPAKFPPQPRWATWIYSRTDTFKLHNSLGQCKNAITGRELGSRQGRSAKLNGREIYERPLAEGFVYEWVVDDAGEGWVLRFHVQEGDWRSEHPLWQATEKPRKARPVSQKAIDEAIASITGGQ